MLRQVVSGQGGSFIPSANIPNGVGEERLDPGLYLAQVSTSKAQLGVALAKVSEEIIQVYISGYDGDLIGRSIRLDKLTLLDEQAVRLLLDQILSQVVWPTEDSNAQDREAGASEHTGRNRSGDSSG